MCYNIHGVDFKKNLDINLHITSFFYVNPKLGDERSPTISNLLKISK